jgi:hypothetical protein
MRHENVGTKHLHGTVNDTLLEDVSKPAEAAMIFIVLLIN